MVSKVMSILPLRVGNLFHKSQYIDNGRILKMVSQGRRDAIIRPKTNNHKYSVNLSFLASLREIPYFKNINI